MLAFVGHNNHSLSIRMSRGTGLLGIASQGLSHPFLKTFAAFFPTQLTTTGSPSMVNSKQCLDIRVGNIEKGLERGFIKQRFNNRPVYSAFV